MKRTITILLSSLAIALVLTPLGPALVRAQATVLNYFAQADGTGDNALYLGGTWYVDGTSVTSSGAELNILDGVTASAAELNIVDGVLATAAEINRATDVSTRIVDVTGTSVALTEATHESKVVTLNRAAGIAVTLPAATGGGGRYTLVVGTTFSGAATVKVVGDDIMVGTATLFQDSGDTVVGFATAADSDTIDLLGTSNSTGGIAGAVLELVDIAANTWFVRYVSDAGGTEATPFSATVTP